MVGAGRVGGDFVEHGHGHAVLSEQFDHALLDAELFHELVFGDAQEGLLAGQGKSGEFIQAARAEDDPGGSATRLILRPFSPKAPWRQPDSWPVRSPACTP